MASVMIKELKEIPYLGEERAERMDAYLPEDCDSASPAILLIHGGGWHLSDKAADREVSISRDLAKAGYAVFSVNYLLNCVEAQGDGTRKLTRLAWPTNFYDCKTALRFIRKFADRYRVAPTRIAVMGSSAGAHLAMLLASTSFHEGFNQQGLYLEQSNAVTCVVNLYGDYDVRGRAVSPFAGETPEQTELNEREASPITWIDSKMPPMLIAHGAQDATVSVDRSRLLVRHLENLGLDYLYLELSKDAHSFDLHPRTFDLEAAVLSFLTQYL